MLSDPVQQPLSDSPLYIRWGPDRCPYAIELKLDLVASLRTAIVQAAAGGLEVGGVLVGSLPTPQVQTLRIEDIELIARRSEDGATFMLDGGGERFAEVRRRARTRERSAVGIFRSHLRSGPLRPSLADRTLLAEEFKDPVYALFLAEAADSFKAAFFVASNGPLPAEPSVRDFRLDSADFESLPEIEPEFRNKEDVSVGRSKRSRLGAMTAVLFVALLIGGVLFYLNQSVFSPWLPSSASLGLSANSQDGLLRVAWNHAASGMDQSRGALLTIRAPNSADERRIHLGLDELRLGAVCYESNLPWLEVNFTILKTGASQTESIVWKR